MKEGTDGKLEEILFQMQAIQEKISENEDFQVNDTRMIFPKDGTYNKFIIPESTNKQITDSIRKLLPSNVYLMWFSLDTNSVAYIVLTKSISGDNQYRIQSLLSDGFGIKEFEFEVIQKIVVKKR